MISVNVACNVYVTIVPIFNVLVLGIDKVCARC